MKKIISTMLLLVLMVAVFGCKSSSSNEIVLTVTSHDYKGLKELYAAEIDEEAVKKLEFNDLKSILRLYLPRSFKKRRIICVE